MLAHMSAILKKGGTISFGGLITSIARALNLHAELATLEPLPHRTINLKFLKDMKLCKVRREGSFYLMIHGAVVPSVFLPYSQRTDVRHARNWTYDLDAPPFTGPLPPNVPMDEGQGTNDEYDRRDQSPAHDIPAASPAHTAPSSSNPFAGTTLGFYITEEMWRDHLAREERRDTLLNTINQQLSDNMSFMVASQQRSEKAH